MSGSKWENRGASATGTCLGVRRLGGVIGVLVVVLLIGGVVALWHAYQKHLPNYYIFLYDGQFVRYLDLPPFSKRITSAEDDKTGVCELEINITAEQANDFLAKYCKRKGFVFKQVENGISIDVTPDYVIKGTYKDQRLKLVWQPKLP